jgi:hypothetical protein
MSNFPNGFPNGITIRGTPVTQLYPGRVFWVTNSSTTLSETSVGGADGNAGTYQRPMASIDAAVNKCVAGRGDIIVLGPGHAESVTSATTINLDVAGVAIVGLGAGSSRPTLTFTTANTATIPVSAANISIKNVLFVGNFLSIASAITVAAAPWFTVEDCEFKDTSAILGFLTPITTTVSVNADHLHFINNRVHSIATTTPGPAVVIAGTMTGLTVNDNRVVHGTISNNIAALVEHGALVMTDFECKRNTVYSINTDTATGAILVKTTATTGSGMIAHNRIRALDVAAAIVVTATAVQYGLFDNLYIGDGTSNSGFVLPAIGSDA